MGSAAQLMQDAAGALSRIARGTLREHRVSLSLRVAGSETMIAGCTEDGAALDRLTVVPFAHADADGAWAIHGALYRLRPDAGAVISASLPWAGRLARLGAEMPAVFDEQARHLGLRVPNLAFAGMGFDAASVAAIRDGGNAFLLNEEAVCLGFCKERVVFNAELLEKCAQAYVLAMLCDGRVRRVPFYVRMIAARRLNQDRQRAEAAMLSGEVPSGSRSY